MSKLLALLITALLLTGCAALETYQPGQDLGQAIADARATQNAAQAQMRATDREANRISADATQEAAATAGAARIELDLLQARSAATQSAQDMEIERARVTDAAALSQATQTAAAGFARMTETAGERQAAIAALQDYATQTATVLQMDEAQLTYSRTEQSRFVFHWIRLVGFGLALACAVGILVYILIRFIPLLLNWIIEWIDRPFRFHETRTGSVVWLPGMEHPVLITQLPERGAALRLPPGASETDNVTRLTSSGSVLSSPMQPGITSMTVAMLKAAVKVNGAGSNQIPRWDKLGWSPRPLGRVIAALEEAQAVIVEPNNGTFVTDEFQTVGNLLFAVEMKQLKLKSPSQG